MKVIDGDHLRDWIIARGLEDPNLNVHDILNQIDREIEYPFTLFAPSTADEDKYEYHYDHTDCIWYRPEARNRCPATCAQYRDGWNDAMNYIFRDGKGYRPYRRGETYGE